MKRTVNVTEIEDDGFISLLGKKIFVLCARYSYAGILSGVNESCICISNPSVVYETGAWTSITWKDAQAMGTKELFVQTSAIESFMEGK